jgi:hypothetical protein
MYCSLTVPTDVRTMKGQVEELVSTNRELAATNKALLALLQRTECADTSDNDSKKRARVSIEGATGDVRPPVLAESTSEPCKGSSEIVPAKNWLVPYQVGGLPWDTKTVLQTPFVEILEVLVERSLNIALTSFGGILNSNQRYRMGLIINALRGVLDEEEWKRLQPSPKIPRIGSDGYVKWYNSTDREKWKEEVKAHITQAVQKLHDALKAGTKHYTKVFMEGKVYLADNQKTKYHAMNPEPKITNLASSRMSGALESLVSGYKAHGGERPSHLFPPV